MGTIAPETREFAGSKAEREHAAELFRLMQSVGRFMSINAPIRLSLDSAVEFFADQEDHQERARRYDIRKFGFVLSR